MLATIVSRLQYAAAPALAPIPPAIVMAVEVHSWMFQSTEIFYLSLFGGIVAALAIETSGAISAYGALRFYKNNRLLFSICLSSLIIYAGVGIYVTFSTPLWPFFLLATSVYLVAGALTISEEIAAREAEKIEAEEMTEKKSEKKEIEAAAREIEKMHQERLLTNARTRQIKASSLSSERPVVSTGQLDMSAGQADKRPVCRLDVKEELERDAARSDRKIAEVLSLSPTTVGVHRRLWEKETKKVRDNFQVR